MTNLVTYQVRHTYHNPQQYNSYVARQLFLASQVKRKQAQDGVHNSCVDIVSRLNTNTHQKIFTEVSFIPIQEPKTLVLKFTVEVYIQSVLAHVQLSQNL